MIRGFMALGALLAAGLAVSCPVHAQGDETDVREFRVGMKLSALPAQGYGGFACAMAQTLTIAGWRDYRQCPVDRQGLHEIGFRYDDDGAHETKVAGQPMLLTLLMDEDGSVQAIRMQTDPSARLFLRKRGYMFGEQVMARYGDAGWACKEAGPDTDEAPVGGIFVREHCEKTLGDRHLVVDREMFRGTAAPLTSFTSRTVFTVSLVSAQ